MHELLTLKTIAETLNQSNELEPMLNTALAKLLELTGLTTGWIFIVDGAARHESAAEYGLPPALLYNDREPMACSRCWCLDRYKDGRLKNAVNILGCKRLEDAAELRWGDTNGITHHATVPLWSGERRIGLLNVAAPGKNRFSDGELALLQAVAFQIGGAIERMRLYAEEQRRADRFARLGEFSRALGAAASAVQAPRELADRATALIGEHFDWPVAAVFDRVGSDLVLRAVHAAGGSGSVAAGLRLPLKQAGWLEEAVRDRHYCAATPAEAAALADRGLPPLASAMAASIPAAGSGPASILLVGEFKAGDAHRADGEVLEALGEHIAAALESARHAENRRELARLEERNRLARDLHDSVSQMLFSLSMTAKGAESMLRVPDPEAARHAVNAVRDMQSLAQRALKEMRSLIMQLRPAGLEAGIVTALKDYGEKLELRVRTQVAGVRELPRAVEEALWRIGQEALNNVSKHAGTGEAEIALQLTLDQAVLRITDRGPGLAKPAPLTQQQSYGLLTMQERAESLGGTLSVTSGSGQGTAIEAAIPLPETGQQEVSDS
ncbi:GAF domain-containing protein [Paenibacillus piri]|uniref:histidine kinase n=2 Tax=Paenibacillus piri TaxID=2547395 RepID=A0A4R5KEQ3_9BACL|nr:GAF domain-containing sensor histidine kinase [Paenibacillus piri]TDF92620.1 GAF domain-containing protein [Paenibacillus piri]